MSSLQTKERILGYDLLKALAMFLVVFYHFQMLDFAFTPGEFYIPNLNKIIQLICAAGVPLFFMVNGALTVHKKTTFKKVIIKVIRLLGIAIFWSLLLNCGVLGYLMGGGLPQSVNEIIDYYWFLRSLAMVYIINYLIQILPKWCGYLLVVAIFSLTFLNNFIWDIILYINPEQSLPRWGHTGLFTLYGVVYSRIGAYLKDKKLNHYICSLIFMAGLALNIFKTIVMTNYDGIVFDGVNGSFPTIGALLLSISLFCVLKDIKSHFWSSQLIETVGINSIGVYIFHFVFLAITKKYFYRGLLHMDYLPLYLVFISALLITVLCAFISKGISRTPCKLLLKL